MLAPMAPSTCRGVEPLRPGAAINYRGYPFKACSTAVFKSS